MSSFIRDSDHGAFNNRKHIFGKCFRLKKSLNDSQMTQKFPTTNEKRERRGFLLPPLLVYLFLMFQLLKEKFNGPINLYLT